jgi:hypothetical protein
MPKLTRDQTVVVTVKLHPNDPAKLKAIAGPLHRTRADIARQMIAHTELTGLPDIQVTGLEQHPAQGGYDAT